MSITADIMINPIGLFQIIARAGSFNHIASNQSLKLEYAKLQAGISTLEAIPTLESSLSLSKQDRTVGGSS